MNSLKTKHHHMCSFIILLLSFRPNHIIRYMVLLDQFFLINSARRLRREDVPAGSAVGNSAPSKPN